MCQNVNPLDNAVSFFSPEPIVLLLPILIYIFFFLQNLINTNLHLFELPTHMHTVINTL